MARNSWKWWLECGRRLSKKLLGHSPFSKFLARIVDTEPSGLEPTSPTTKLPMTLRSTPSAITSSARAAAVSGAAATTSRSLLAAACLISLGAGALAEDCKAIPDAAARLACFDGGTAPATAAASALDFATVKAAMNAKYAPYFAHHKTTLIGTKTAGDRKLFYIRVPDPNPSLQILASCLRLDAGGWMCTLVPNYGTFGALPLPIKAN